ncbi:MAG: hypothetical protein PHV93_00060 [Candidatus Pacebacteria bacterium]|nr:hypothetical protein [Candidatus Paceibacterota bacterium]
MSNKPVEVCYGAVDDSHKTAFVIRGAIASESLCLLKTAPYQREARPLSRLEGIIEAIKKGVTLPDIELGMRGSRYSTPSSGGLFLKDDVYIVDGLQRVTAAMHVMQMNPEVKPLLGAAIHFNTTEETERERFRILNTQRIKLSPNLILRNMEATNDAIRMFRALCEDARFALKDRVVWGQNARRGELLSAATLLKASGVLHSHIGAGSSTNIEELAAALERTMQVVGRNIFRENVRNLLDIIDQCWGVKTVSHAGMAPHLKEGFLRVFTRYLSKHPAFWRDGKRLFVEMDLIRKIKLFNIYDPTVVNLCSSSGKSQYILYQMLRDHVNSGKRGKRLEERKVEGDDAFGENQEPEAEDTGGGETSKTELSATGSAA